jgi:uncharacterized membrane protein YgcG
MPFYVKSRGPVVVGRGPFDTEEKAKDVMAKLKLEPMYESQEFSIELEHFARVTPRRSTHRRTRKKPNPRGRSGGRGQGRSTGGGASGSGSKRPRKRQNRRAGKRRT